MSDGLFANQAHKTEINNLNANSTICRSALFMPASNTRALSKGPNLEADAIILDLEDSIANDAKTQARENAVNALKENDYGYRLRVIRVNERSTQWYQDDMALLQQVKPDAVLLPKVDSVDTIADAQRLCDECDDTGDVKIWAMVESPKAVLEAVALAKSSERYTRLSTLCIGNNDLARDAGMKLDSSRSVLLPWIMHLLAAAKAYNLTILDGVYNDFADLAGFEQECEQGAAMGMNGKALIHPKQIELSNRIYSPSQSEIEQARRIVDAFATEAGKTAGVLQIDGRMVERLHLSMAQRTLAIADRIKALS